MLSEMTAQVAWVIALIALVRTITFVITWAAAMWSPSRRREQRAMKLLRRRTR